MGLDELVNQYFDQLSENDLYIWDYISKHKKECEKLTVNELASHCNISRTTILRFAQKLSLKGYSELKVHLKMDNEKSIVDTNDVDMVCGAYETVINNIKERDCTEVFQLLDSCETIYVYGEGMLQSSIKKEFKRIFMMSGKMVYDISGHDETEAIINQLTQKDVFVLISVSGKNEFILNLAKTLKIYNIPIISITKLKDNLLARISDYSLYTTTVTIHQSHSEIEYESVTSYFILIELLYIKYMEYKGQMRGIVE